MSILLKIIDGRFLSQIYCKYCFIFYCRIQSLLKHENVKINLGSAGGATDIEDKLDMLMDANDQILEKVVNIHSVLIVKCMILV